MPRSVSIKVPEELARAFNKSILSACGPEADGRPADSAYGTGMDSAIDDHLGAHQFHGYMHGKDPSTRDISPAAAMGSPPALTVSEGPPTRDISPADALRDPTALAVNTVYQYDVKIVGGDSLCGAARKQILKAFKKQVIPEKMNGAVSQLSRSSFIAAQPIRQLEQEFRVHVHIAADAETTFAASRAKYVKVHDHKEDGETVKQWMLLGDMVPVPQTPGLSLRQAFSDPKHGTAYKQYAGRRRGDRNERENELIAYAKQEHGKAVGKEDGKHWTHTVVIMVDRTKFTIGRPEMVPPMLGNEATNDEKRSRLAQLFNGCMLSQAKPDGSLQLGNRLFGEATALDCGLEVRDGIRVKPGVCEDDENVHIIKTECRQHFYQPILLSDFMLAHFGTSAVSCDPSKADELTQVLKGVQVMVATSKGGKSRTIQGVTHKTASSLAICRDGDEGPFTLADLYEGKRLRHPTMPCINIGFAGRDHFVLAEACQLMPNQPFNHKLPFYANEQDFTQRPQIPKASHSSVKSTDAPHFPFSKIDASKLDVLFAEVVVHPDSSRRSDLGQLRLVQDKQWVIFQNEIKSRFKGAISDSVRKFRKKQNQYPPILLPYALRETEAAPRVWAEKLREALRAKPDPASSSIVVVAVPAGKHNADIYKALKKVCETDVGIQCKVIRTNVLSKIVRSSEEVQKLFTGAIVRNLLARTLHPPALDQKYSDDKEYQLRFPERGEEVERGLLYGVHVQPVESSKIRTATGEREWKIAPDQLITITSSALWIPGNVSTTHHLLSTFPGNSPAERLSECMYEHNEACKYDSEITHVALYRSGEGAGSHLQFRAEVKRLLQDHFGDAKRAFVAYVPETVVQLLGKSAPIPDDDKGGHRTASNLFTASLLNGSQVPESQRDGDRSLTAQYLREMTNPFGLDAAFRRTYARDPLEVQESIRTYLLTHCYSEETKQAEKNIAGVFPHSCFSVLRNTAVPDILHLAQQASKYIQRFVEEVAGDEMKFELKDVKEELRGTLYYV
ncbi:hypothetical protein B0A55_11257 [Friedmanniomyces simplex]|uniref:PAZ domain-containing protein n=1 Tax=Friedmanniomyces simplex TaxID=329884 RepID=A0A4U0WNC7_9PEZI|nr:hypothetical protein B0A55_11257 [Friedmanniomyces simplex]